SDRFTGPAVVWIQPPTQPPRAAPSTLGTRFSSLSPAYMIQASESCFPLLRHLIPCAFVFALAKAGRSMLARIAMIAITTSSSIRVKPRWRGGGAFMGLILACLPGWIESRRVACADLPLLAGGTVLAADAKDHPFRDSLGISPEREPSIEAANVELCRGGGVKGEAQAAS